MAGIDGGLGEGWVRTLALAAAFDDRWVTSAAAWAVEGMAGAVVVDVGSGSGGAARAFAARPEVGVVVAVDRDTRLLELVGAAAHRAHGVVGNLPVRAGGADVVWASGVVHHVPDQQAAVHELAVLLRPGGRLALLEGGLPLRCLPHDAGIGRPGLEARLDEARARWFEDLRTELGGPPLPYGWPAALARAGLVDVRTRSYIAEATSPLDEVGRRVARRHLESARDELGDRLDPDDRAAVGRLLDPDDPQGVDRRDDLTVMAVRTVQVGRLSG